MSQDFPAARDNPALSRFEMDVNGAIVFARYRREGHTVVITHVETPPALRGHGMASNLMEATLGLIRRNGEKVVAACGFARAYLADHSEHDDLRG